jgi:catechol 2,3-dioxygenase-like lactoylglutathione lyase family enzyme
VVFVKHFCRERAALRDADRDSFRSLVRNAPIRRRGTVRCAPRMALSTGVSPTAKLDAVEGDREPVEAISAVTLRTSDMGASVAFYRAMGFQLLYGGPGAPFTSFRAGPGYLNLQADHAAPATGANWGRVVLWVDDVDRAYRRALDSGLTPEAAPADAEWGERYFHLRDPDGHELSFARPSRDDTPSQPG